MTIEWTNNSTDNLNLWNQDDTATWTVTDDGDITTGVIPEWIRTGDFDDRPQFYFANARERTMMVEQGVDTPGDVYRGESGEVSYDATTRELTISEPLRMELNNWTVQVTQTSDSGVFRWPGWGAMTVPWADPGCHAWDLNVGDQTHLITRTFELEGDDGFSEADELDADQSGVWRVSYSIDGAGDTITRDVSLPDDANTDFDTPLTPQDPAPGARAHFSGGLLITHDDHDQGMNKLFVDDAFSEFVGMGDYPSNATTFPQSIAYTFDAIAVDEGVRCIIYSKTNFAGSVLFDRTGPFILWNNLWNGKFSWSDWRDGNDDPQQPGVKYEDIFPPSVRLFSTSNMHEWNTGSMKLRQVS